MSNIIPFGQAEVPAHAKKKNDGSFLAGISSGGFPTIGCKGTRFFIKDGGDKTPVMNKDGNVATEIIVCLLGARPVISRSYYADSFDPNTSDEKAPDCKSLDGVRPDDDSTCKQAESCAGCAHNQWGSGKDAKGNPSKGKACTESKMLAIYANRSVYGFKIPPMSLKNFRAYVQEAERHDVDLKECWTVIKFDSNYDYPVYEFGLGGYVSPAQSEKLKEIHQSPQVQDIISVIPSVPAIAHKAEPAKIAEIKKDTTVGAAFDAMMEDIPATGKKTRKPKETKIEKVEQVEAELVDDASLDQLALDMDL